MAWVTTMRAGERIQVHGADFELRHSWRVLGQPLAPGDGVNRHRADHGQTLEAVEDGAQIVVLDRADILLWRADGTLKKRLTAAGEVFEGADDGKG